MINEEGKRYLFFKLSGRNQKVILAFSLIAILLASVFLRETGEFDVITLQENPVYTAPAELTDTVEYVQTVPSLFHDVQELFIQFANYGNRANEGTVSLQVYQENRMIGSRNMQAAEIGDGIYYQVPLNQTPTMGEAVEIRVSADSEAGKGVTILCTNNEILDKEGASLSINGAKQTTHMNLRYIYRSPQLSMEFWEVCGFLCILLTYFGAFQFYLSKDTSKQVIRYMVLFFAALLVISLRNLTFIREPIIYAEDGIFLGKGIKEGFLKSAFLTRGGVASDFTNTGTYILLWLALKATHITSGYDLTMFPFWNGVFGNSLIALTAVLGYVAFKTNNSKKMGAVAYFAVILMNLGNTASETLGRSLNTQFLWVVSVAFMLMILYTNRDQPLRWQLFGQLFCAIGALSFPVCFLEIGGYLFFDVLTRLKNRESTGRIMSRNLILLLVLLYGVIRLPGLMLSEGSGANYAFKKESAIEFFVARHILYPLIAPFYRKMNDGLVVILFIVYLLTVLYAGMIVMKKYKTIFNEFTLYACLTLGVCFSSAFMRRTMTQIFNHYSGTYPDRYYYGCNILAFVLFALSAVIIVSAVLEKKHATTICVTLIIVLAMNPHLVEYTISDNSCLYGGEYQGMISDACKYEMENPDSLTNGFMDIKTYPNGWTMKLPIYYVIETAK